MACEQELADLNQAIAPLDGHIADLDAAIAAVQQANLAVAEKAAIVNSDLQNINAKQLLYNQCMNQQGPPQPMQVNELSLAFGHMRAIDMKIQMAAVDISNMRHNTKALKRIEWTKLSEPTSPCDWRPGMP